MKLTVKLFAAARELVGGDQMELTLPADASIGQLRMALIAAAPQLASLAARSLIAVNEEYASDTTRLRQGDVAALIPPVSGG
ncbi:MAG: MoaD/ThiS family protein [Planctomycetaceae bacterium]|uniref:Molybdopterin synthase sulfur carrier subunit n=1 Tax=Lacipirellula limnantheis TaxID=2528024 RepID=A0A517TWY3_9BACT|nr:MoaD/ThiS family protein [Lacipirellula limnantheis]MBL9163627.1 MoaD/ThiS family protein [Planctomycetaceae bacterium]QDT72877.1 Molybdopterin synthase sulfur carrier subunit [Lacipirellula limnantheis]